MEVHKYIIWLLLFYFLCFIFLCDGVRVRDIYLCLIWVNITRKNCIWIIIFCSCSCATELVSYMNQQFSITCHMLNWFSVIIVSGGYFVCSTTLFWALLMFYKEKKFILVAFPLYMHILMKLYYIWSMVWSFWRHSHWRFTAATMMKDNISVSNAVCNFLLLSL